LAPVKETIPQGGGDTIQLTRYKKISGLRGDNSNEFAAQQMYLSAVIVQALLHERDGYVQISRFASLTAIGKLLDQATDKVKAAATKTVDLLIRNDIGMIVADVANASSLNMQNMSIDGGTLNSTGKTARVWSHDRSAAGDRFPVYHNKTRLAQSALVTSFAKTGLTVKTVQNGVMRLRQNDIEPCSDGYFHMITPVGAAYQITTNPGFKGWISPTNSSPLKEDPTKIGVIAGVMIHETNMALSFPLSADTLSTASGELYCSFLFGDEAYGCASIEGEDGAKGFSFYLKQSGAQSTNDPTNKIKQAAFSVTNVGKVLNKSAGLWMLSTSQV
jgi:N4-gp56 family major capsid protein